MNIHVGALTRNKPPFRAEHIGSLLRPVELLEQRRRFTHGEISQNELTAAENAAIADAIVLTSEIQAGWSGLPNVIAHIKVGKLRGLCVSVLKRAASLPDVPTCDEAGIKGFDVADMLGLQGPAGMSPKVVERLQVAVAKVTREPAMAERMATLGMDMQENGTANYARFMKDDIDKYAKVIDRLGLKQKQVADKLEIALTMSAVST